MKIMIMRIISAYKILNKIFSLKISFQGHNQRFFLEIHSFVLLFSLSHFQREFFLSFLVTPKEKKTFWNIFTRKHRLLKHKWGAQEWIHLIQMIVLHYQSNWKIFSYIFDVKYQVTMVYNCTVLQLILLTFLMSHCLPSQAIS